MSFKGQRLSNLSNDDHTIPLDCHYCVYYIAMDDVKGECHYSPPIGRNVEYKDDKDLPELSEWLFPVLDGANYCSKWKWNQQIK